MKIQLFGINVNIETKEKLIGNLKSEINGKNKYIISKINSEFLVRATKVPDFLTLLDKSDHIITDGVGVSWAARYLSIPISKSPLLRPIQAIYQMVYSGASLVLYPKFCTYPISVRLPGIEAFKLMLRVAENEKAGVYFFGGREEVLQKAIEKIKEEYPNLIISGFQNGYDQKDKAVELINKTDAKLLFVGLGAPEQEKWIVDNLPKLEEVRIAVGEGGTIDRIANPFIKAPNWINRLGVEWLWRTFTSRNLTTGAGPRVKRVWNSVPKLIFEAVMYKIKNGQVEVIDEKN